MGNSSSFTATILATRVGGEVLGDPTISVSGISALEAATPGTLSFIRTSSKDHVTQAIAGRTAQHVLLVPAALAPTVDSIPASVAVIGVKDPYAAFLDLIPLFFGEREVAREVHPTAFIHPSAVIGDAVAIGPHCSIAEGVTIGDNAVLHAGVRIYRDANIGSSTTLHSGVSIREECIVGDHCIIHNNAVIGADGFGYVPDPQVGLRKVPQVGNVIIGSRVEVGANTCIDRGAFGSTTIGDGTKIDNLAQVGHNATIGKFCIICGQVGIAGSAKIGDQVVMAGGSGCADHVSICSGTRIGGWAGATSDISEPGDYLGFPAEKAGTWRRTQAIIRRLASGGKKKPTKID